MYDLRRRVTAAGPMILTVRCFTVKAVCRMAMNNFLKARNSREFYPTELKITKCNSQMLPATPAGDVSQSRSLVIIPAMALERGGANCER